MKRFIFSIALVIGLTSLATYKLEAQNLPNNPVTVTAVDPRGTSNTTLVAPDTAIVPTPAVKTLYNTFTISMTLTKVSGTVAGTALFQGSMDGTKFYTISSTALANQTTNDLYYEDGYTNWNYYRIYLPTSGTNTVTVSDTKYLYKK